MPAEIAVHVTELPGMTELAAIWSDLERRSQGSFFVSWCWIGTWLDAVTAQCRPRLVRAERAGLTVGLAIVGARRFRRRGLVPVALWAVHETGDPALDALTVEYNDFLVDTAYESTVRNAMANALFAQGEWDECRLAYWRRNDLVPPSALNVVVTPFPTFAVDLAALRTQHLDYLGALRQRQRYLVRKSLKRLGERGAFKLTLAQTVEEAQTMFDRMVGLHTRYWAARGEAGAFATAPIRQFHQRLIARGHPEGSIVVMSLGTQEAEYGVLYFFCHRGHVYYYQSGIDYAAAPGDSPGLAAHALAIEHFMAQGCTLYDFMAGDQQYKRTLSLVIGELYWIVLQRPLFKFRLEAWAREGVHAVRRFVGKEAAT